jgi:thiol-disulfide isomerase/thioredoxin
MANATPPDQSPRPLLNLAIVAGVVLAGVLGWYAWRITGSPTLPGPVSAQPARPSPSLPPGAPPPAPEVPMGTIVAEPTMVLAPSMDLPTIDGKRFKLSDARGQVVVVNFWATWCPPCAKEMPSMVKLGQELTRRHPGKFRMVAVSVDEEDGAVQKFFAGAPYSGLPKDVVVALEPGTGEVTRRFYCNGRGACGPQDVKFPETYIVDPSGRISAFVVGDIDWSAPSVRQYLEALIPG